jgi:hypothetical protein
VNENIFDFNLCAECLCSFIQHNQFGESGDDDQASISGKVTTVHTTKANYILQQNNNNNDSDESKFYNEAVAETNNFHAALIQQEEKNNGGIARGGVCDSFVMFKDSYIQLYQVFKAKSWEIKSWKKLVQHIHKVYREEGGSYHAGLYGRKAIDWALTVAADGDQPFEFKQDSGVYINNLVTEAETQANKLKTKYATYLAYNQVKNVVDSNDYSFKTKARDYRKQEFGTAAGSTPIQSIQTGKLYPADNLVNHLVAKESNALVELNRTDLREELSKYYTTDIRPEVLLNVLVLSSKSPQEAQHKLDSLVSSEKNSSRTGIAKLAKNSLRGGNITEAFKQIKAKWGQDKVNEEAEESKANSLVNSSNIEKLTEKQIVELLKGGKINGQFMQFCIDCDVLPPIGYRGVRHLMTYIAGTAWMAEGGGACASTLFGHADFQLADDAARKVHYGHFTMYNKTVIWSRQHIVHARNVFIRDYLGGNGTLVYDPLDAIDVESYSIGQIERDIHLIPCPISTFTNARQFDISGSYHPNLSPSKQSSEETDFFGLRIYGKRWGWTSRQLQRDPLDTSFFSEGNPKTNTICFQGHQGIYNHATGNLDRIITEKGHWGPNVYAGCGQSRKGGQGRKTFLHCAYNGTSTTQLVKV